ncbi:MULTISPECIES: hypothetical protein [Actinoplanes]|uniref:hypothetical protein n=1 Tax=Actinoplanes TaxID=1865 RepID=UPI0012F9C5EF|nr:MULTISPECIES: hypothetical protein [Actinoplanes]
MSMPRRVLFPTMLALTTALLVGCTATPQAAPEVIDLASTLSFDFLLEQDDGMDQILKITNSGQQAVAPVLRFTALDKAGEPIPGVVAYSVFGTERGRLVVPAGDTYELMRFSGKREAEVADVAVRIEKAPQADFPAVRAGVAATPLDEAGKKADLDAETARVRLTNDNEAPVTVRVLYAVWEMPENRPEGVQERQQVWSAFPIGDLITVPAKGDTAVPMTEGWNKSEYAKAPTSLLVFYSR